MLEKNFSKARKYVDTLEYTKHPPRWRGFAAYAPKCDLHS